MRWAKVALFVGCLIPLFALAWRMAFGDPGANPVETVLHTTGDWTLRFLLLTLAITPAKIWLGWGKLVAFRRMLGLYSFFYACLHFTIWLVLDRQFDWAEILIDIGKRPYITLGFAAFLLLIPLAATSTAYAFRRLGANWKKLHRAVYLIAILGVIHYWWLVKADWLEPLVYAIILAVLLAARIGQGRGVSRGLLKSFSFRVGRIVTSASRSEDSA